MSDRLKFRYWDIQKKGYFTCGEIDHKSGISTCYPYRTFEWCIERPKFILPEQCTGLKDKNGKLIYEGDIVEYYNEKIYQNFREEVLPFRELRTKGIMRHLIDERNADKLEVIGNIHENKELLDE